MQHFASATGIIKQTSIPADQYCRQHPVAKSGETF